MSSVYKKFTPQDYAIVPFNAHKHYNFTSASAASNAVTYYNTKWTSESISLYSSASAAYGGDTINTTKYNQIDNLFYRNFKKINSAFPSIITFDPLSGAVTERPIPVGNWSAGNRYLGQNNINYLKHKRILYKEANILSIPTGLYGYEIKPNSVYISSSAYEFKDDGYGNLLLYSDSAGGYETDIRSNVLNIGPIKGFKKYDLNTYSGYSDNGTDSYFYRDGVKRVNSVSSYSTPEGDEYDDSYFFNLLKYKNVNFSERPLFRGSFPCIDFSGDDSELKTGNNGNFYFNKGDDFTITFWASVSQSTNQTSYLISKSTTKESIAPDNKTQMHSSASNPYSIPYETDAEPQYPFEIYHFSSDSPDRRHLVFRRSDGNITTEVTSSSVSVAKMNSLNHYTCRVSASQMEIFVNGIAEMSLPDNSVDQTQNTANVYIGNKGGKSNFLSGSMSQINIYNKALTDTQVLNHYSSSNGSPYVGNAFYQNGFITITHPSYKSALGGIGIGEMEIGNNFIVDANQHFGINTLQFQGSHQIYEHEYQCTIEEHEFNYTTNISARKIKSNQEEELANFTTSSVFKPYVTTVGLYNEMNELLVVGKFAQPIRCSNETDTTFVLRWDT